MRYILCVLSGILVVNLSSQDTFRLSVLHLSDSHVFIEYDNDSVECTENETGYFVRHMPEIAAFIEEKKSEDKIRGLDTIILNTGSFTDKKWSDEFYNESDPMDAAFLKYINNFSINFSSFGHHGFSFEDEDGIKMTESFLDRLSFQVLSSTQNEIKLRNVHPTGIYLLDNQVHKVGVIGYYTPHRNSEKFAKDEKTTINKEAKRLRSTGIKTVIAMGHSGRQTDGLIAVYCPEVDLFVGAHTTQKETDGIYRNYPYFHYSVSKNERNFNTCRVHNAGLFISGLLLTIDSDTGYLSGIVPRTPENLDMIPILTTEPPITTVTQEHSHELDDDNNTTPTSSGFGDGTGDHKKLLHVDHITDDPIHIKDVEETTEIEKTSAPFDYLLEDVTMPEPKSYGSGEAMKSSRSSLESSCIIIILLLFTHKYCD